MTTAGGPKSINMCFLSTNVRSLFNKLEELEILLKRYSPLFLAVQETWCQQNEKDALYSVKGYTLYRRDRVGRRGGGVCVFVNNAKAAAVQREHTLDSATNEDLWLRISVKSTQQQLLVCSVYRPPNSPLVPFMQALEKSLVAAQRTGCHLLLAGDFNARCHAWYDGDSTDEAGDELSQLFYALNLTQLNSFPTNVYGEQLRGCIDIVCTDRPEGVVTKSLSPVGNSDHVVIHGVLTALPDPKPGRRRVRCWSRVDLPRLREAVRSADWEDVLSCNDVNAGWQLWKTRLLDIAAQLVPTRELQCAPQPRPWATAEVAKQTRLKHQLFRKFKRLASQEAWEAFRRQRNKVASLVRRTKSAYVLGFRSPYDTGSAAVSADGNTTDQQPCRGNTIGQLQPDRRNTTDQQQPERQKTNDQQQLGRRIPRLHQFLRYFTRVKSAVVPDLESSTGRLVSSDFEKAALLNTFFTSQARKSSGEGLVPPITPNIPAVTDPTEQLDQIILGKGEVCAALRAIDPSKAAGCDGIPTTLLLMVAEEITPCVHHLFQLSLTTGTLPDEWKCAAITPVYKGRGSRQAPSSYRPISLLSVLSKVLERLVCAPLYEHLDKFLPLHQSGFRRHDNTTLQLARIVHQIAKAMQDGKMVYACLYDLSKAFDRVWHTGLLAKLAHFGVSGKMLSWLESYLTGRQQCVRVNGEKSNWLGVPAGVPQGSVLGPLLFLAYTADLPHAVVDDNTQCDQFADDTALIAIGSTQPDTSSSLQVSVDSTAQWLSDWRLSVNVDKTVVMEFARRNLPSSLNISLDGSSLRKVQSQRHLGVILSSDLRWSQHVDHVLAKASPLLGTLARLRTSLSQGALSVYYKVYIRPVLEYASVAWSNLPAHLRDRMERFQRRAAKIILRKPLFLPSDHDELLHLIDWASLASRRDLQHAILGYQIATQTAPTHVMQEAFPTRTAVERPCRTGLRHSPFFLTPVPNAFYFSHSPLFYTSTLFNQLPPALQAQKTLTLFKEGAAEALLTRVCPCTQHIR